MKDVFKTSDERTDLQFKVCDEIHGIVSKYFNLNDAEFDEYYDECWSSIDNAIYNFELELKEKIKKELECI